MMIQGDPSRLCNHSAAQERQVVLVTHDQPGRRFDLVTPSAATDTTAPAGGRSLSAPLTRREKIKLALAEARAGGRTIGRRRVVVPIEQAQALLDQGKSFRQASRVLGISVGTLHRAVHQERAAHEVVQVAHALQETA